MTTSQAQPPIDRFFALTADLCCTMTPEGGLLTVNPAWLRVLSGVDEPLARSFPDILHPEDRDRAMSALAGLVPGPAQVTFEARVISCEAAVRWLRVRAQSFAGEPCVMVAAADITEAKGAEDSRREEDHVHRQILDAIADLVLVKGPQSRIVWANKAFRDLYGMTGEQLYNLIDAPFNEPDYTLQYIKDDSYVFATGKTLDIPSEPVTRHDGAVRALHTVKTALRSSKGEIVMTAGVSRDITERRRKEQELREMDRAITAASEAIWIADAKAPGSPITYVNAAFERQTGFAQDEVLGRPWRELLGRLNDEAALEDVLRTVAGGVTSTAELLTRRKSGAPLWIRLSVTPVPGESGEVTSLVGMQSDVTAERERAEQERHAQEEALKQQTGLIERQQQALHAMATPILEIWAGVLAMPLIGIVDGTRAASMMEALLAAIVRTQSRYTIVDLTGIEVADTSTTSHLLNLVQAAGLLGTTCVLSGISPGVAMIMVAMDTDLGGLRTFSTLRSALWHVLQKLNVAVLNAEGAA
jgi:rsbT co-antagonist protein RsbR